MICKCCGIDKDLKEFYIAYKQNKKENKLYSQECKKCIANSIDVNDYNTYDKYLKELDLPYFKELWDILKNHYKTPEAVFTKYNSRMRLYSFQDYHYKDNEELKKYLDNKN